MLSRSLRIRKGIDNAKMKSQSGPRHRKQTAVASIATATCAPPCAMALSPLARAKGVWLYFPWQRRRASRGGNVPSKANQGQRNSFFGHRPGSFKPPAELLRTVPRLGHLPLDRRPSAIGPLTSALPSVFVAYGRLLCSASQ